MRIETIINPKNTLFIFILAFTLRIFFLCVVIINVTYLTPDSFDYICLARGIIENNVYGSSGNPELFRVPLYPAVVSCFILIFKSHFIFTLLVFQAVLDSLTAILVVNITNFLIKEKSAIIGFIAGVIYALSPLCIAYSAKLLSETIFVFLLAVLFILSLKLINRDTSGSMCPPFGMVVFIGLLAGTLCLARAIFIPLSVLFLLWIAFRVKKINCILALVIFSLLVPGVWIIRNYHVSGYMGITTVSVVNMYRYNACSVLARVGLTSFAEQQARIDKELNKFSTQKDIAKYCTEKTFSVIRAHPLLYVYLQCKNSINIFLPAVNDLFESFGITIGGKGTLGVLHSAGIFAGIKHYFNDKYGLLYIATPLAIALLIFYGFAIYGIFMAVKDAAGTVFFDHLFIFLTLFYFFIVGGAASTPRFRIPLEPFLCIYAAVGIISFIKIALHEKN